LRIMWIPLQGYRGIPEPEPGTQAADAAQA
jgi:hypothetical protein